MNKQVYITRDSLQSLSIFKDEIHPSLIKGKGKSKEGYSVYMLFEKYAKTNLGKKKLKNWFLTPTYDLNIITKR